MLRRCDGGGREETRRGKKRRIFLRMAWNGVEKEGENQLLIARGRLGSRKAFIQLMQGPSPPLVQLQGEGKNLTAHERAGKTYGLSLAEIVN